ncbi:MAG: DUF362 domain-containing protein [Eubacteriales bacterium]|nr:DUF362 domain-containing protein [Eubacteriales bacterium]
MEKSKVYFTSFRTTPEHSLLEKLRKLIDKAGMTQMPLEGKFAAIKIHFGEPGNLAFLRPNYARVVVDALKDMGAQPFLTDCNTLYPGMRRNALDHLDAAYMNGFSPLQTGCHVIIADGLMGNDHVAVPINGEYCKEALIGRAAVDAEAIISLTHFKCHEATGIGGTLKNLGMGLGSTAGKRAMHNEGKPQVQEAACIGCGMCAHQCGQDAISFKGEGKNRKAFIDESKCAGCGRCVGACRRQGAITGPDSSCDMLNCKIAEYAWAVVKDKPNFHISLVMDVSPFCDCHAENDAPIIPDVGMFASFDPVALDTACAEACMKMEPLPGTFLAEKTERTGDLFHDTHPITNWRVCVEHGEKLGMGTTQYELVEVK